MKVKDYIGLIEKNGDGIGSVHKLTPIGAKGIGMICMVKPGLEYDKINNLPYAAQWSLLETALASDKMKAIQKSVKDFIDNLGEKEIKKGVKSMLSGSRFVIPIELGTSIYGLDIKPPEDKFTKVRDAVKVATKQSDMPDVLQKGMGSEDFTLTMKALSTYNNAPIVLSELHNIMADMDYIDFFKLSNILMDLNNAVFKLDWESILKK